MILEKSPQKFVSKSEMDGSNLKISKDFGNWARANGMHTMNLSSIFCDGFSFTRFSGGDWLYTDESHLSISGAALAIPLFESVFQKLELLS